MMDFSSGSRTSTSASTSQSSMTLLRCHRASRGHAALPRRRRQAELKKKLRNSSVFENTRPSARVCWRANRQSPENQARVFYKGLKTNKAASESADCEMVMPRALGPAGLGAARRHSLGSASITAAEGRVARSSARQTQALRSSGSKLVWGHWLIKSNDGADAHQCDCDDELTTYWFSRSTSPSGFISCTKCSDSTFNVCLFVVPLNLHHCLLVCSFIFMRMY